MVNINAKSLEQAGQPPLIHRGKGSAMNEVRGEAGIFGETRFRVGAGHHLGLVKEQGEAVRRRQRGECGDQFLCIEADAGDLRKNPARVDRDVQRSAHAPRLR